MAPLGPDGRRRGVHRERKLNSHGHSTVQGNATKCWRIIGLLLWRKSKSAALYTLLVLYMASVN